ncbi:hypothetical protein TNCV_2824891 [Trichonephila clavipes]|nr:hypothetical protein TNCV_2824891 [Trichonephila clavipes]
MFCRGNAEVDMALRLYRRQNEQLSDSRGKKSLGWWKLGGQLATRLRTPSTDQSLRRPSHPTTRTCKAICHIGHYPDTGSTFTTGPYVFPNHRKMPG